MVELKYAAYFSYTIIQISRYSNMLQMCRALCKCVLRLNSFLERELLKMSVKAAKSTYSAAADID